jgi:predicted lipid-binding transport protein (Tim44 family)
MDITTIVFMGLAAVVVWRLWAVLGTRTGHEQIPPSRFNRRPEPVPESPLETGTILNHPAHQPDEEVPVERWAGIAAPDSDVARGLTAIATADPTFDGKAFLEGARGAYEMIVTAFAAGDRNLLRDLLSREVFEGFASAIAEREKRGETVEMTFVSIDKATITEAQMRGASAQITVRFVSKLISATRDKDGTIIDGTPDRVVDMTDIWTFARETNQRDPNWKLIATDSGQ